MSTYTAKERCIRQACLRKNLRLSSLIEDSGVSSSFFYRVVRGVQTSAPVDEYLCKALGLKELPSKESANV